MPRFHIEFGRETDGRWIAVVIDLPGVHAYGTTKDDALREVSALTLEVLASELRHGERTADSLRLYHGRYIAVLKTMHSLIFPTLLILTATALFLATPHLKLSTTDSRLLGYADTLLGGIGFGMYLRRFFDFFRIPRA